MTIIAYTVGGMMTSVFVGAVLGSLGGWLIPDQGGSLAIPIALVVAMLALVRELGWLSVPLPQLRRQTQRGWARGFPDVRAATLWGLDLGFALTTRLTFSGVWLLVAVAVLVGDSLLGAALFLSYWAGRAISVWLAPLLLPNANSVPWLLDEIYAQRWLLRRIHVIGVGWTAIVLYWGIALP